MKNYAAMNSEQRAAYNDGLLDAIDVLYKNALEAIDDDIMSASYRVGALSVSIFRNEQLLSDHPS
jgi:hypothetical protein